MTSPALRAHSLATCFATPWWGGNATTAVMMVSVLTGLVMVVIFRYTSNQQAVKRAKEQLQAQLLAVRLFQDQLPVVLHSYGRIIRGTGRYLRVASKPLLVVILPVILLIVQLDRWFGLQPLEPDRPFLVTVQLADKSHIDGVGLQLPEGLKVTAPAVHIPQQAEVVWRVVAERYGNYPLRIVVGAETLSKQVVVSRSLERVSALRTRNFWDRLLSSAEPRLPQSSSVQAIEVTYPTRTIALLGWQWDWLVLFFIVSLLAGFLAKSILRIEI